MRAVVRALRDADYAPGAGREFRDELRAQLVAVTARVVAEGEPAPPAREPNTGGRAGRHTARHRQVRSSNYRRSLTVAAAIVALFALLLGGTTWLSQRALPGDALYGLKRAGEGIELNFTSGDFDRGRAYLVQSQQRVAEAQALTGRPAAFGAGPHPLADGAVSAHTAALIRSTLDAADSDLASGSTLLLAQARNAGPAGAVRLMQGWAAGDHGQQGRLDELEHSVPAGALRDRATESWRLVTARIAQFASLAH